MFCVLLIVATLMVGGSLSFENHVLMEQWENFKVEHGKIYETPEEDESRLAIYLDNLQTIWKHNERYEKGLSTYTMGMNQFGDLTQQEFQDFYQRPYESPSHLEAWQPGYHHHQHFEGRLPKRIDWRITGAVTEVKNQLKCGSCYAFSAIAALESQHFFATGQLISLSEQNIVDCTKKYGNIGCKGGNVNATFQYIIDNKGVDTGSSYPYIGRRNKTCGFRRAEVGATMRKYVNVISGNETDLQVAVVTEGPVSVMVDGAGMRFYSGGLYDDPKCSNQRFNHGMAVVGYGTAQNLDYWIVKNSYGPKWGENGYILMSRNKGNQCAIALSALYPVV